MKRSILWFTILMVALLGQPALALDLPAILSDRMVLQRDQPVPIWGTADPGQAVTVSIAGQQKSAAADAAGAWQLQLDPVAAGGPYTLVVRTERETLEVTDILVGEVWLCSGQSNMRWGVMRSADAEAEIAAANYPEIRLVTPKFELADEPRTDTELKWVACTPHTVAGFSAAGYFFGRRLHEELDVPIGLIHASWGGATAEAWMRRETLEAMPEMAGTLQRFEVARANYPQALAELEARLARWETEAERAKAAGEPIPRKPTGDYATYRHHWPFGLYNGMIAPLVPYGIRGVIWYQGESNTGRADQYRTLFPALIRDWREFWGQGDFPFLFVQLANYGAPAAEPGDHPWAELREAQAQTLSVPGAGMAVAIDIGEANNIHPGNKQEVGRRLALVALRRVYGRSDVIDAGPTFASMSIDGRDVRLRFDHADGGLTHEGEMLEGFTIAGADQRFVPAIARIEGDEVVVWSDQVPEPAAVRYGWAQNPQVNLVNGADLPAVPFRTDHWPGVTDGRQ